MAHTVERVFLGWDRPVLPVAAAHLIEHYVKGGVADLRPATVVLPGQRARRRMIELLLEKAEASGATLIPPEAITLQDLPDLFHSNSKPVAEQVVSRRAWSRALRSVNRDAVEKAFFYLPESDSLAEWDELAGVLAGLHRNLAGEGHRFTDVVKVCRSGLVFDDGDHWEVLARIQRRYLRLLEQAGLTDRFEARMAALESGVASFAGDLWLVSIVELPAVTLRLVEASDATVRTLVHAPVELADGTDATTAFDIFGLPSTNYWETTRIPIDDEILKIVDRPVNQAEAVITWMKTELCGRYSAEEIVVSAHPKSEVMTYLEQSLGACDVSARDAAGVPLSRTVPVRLLQAVADYLDTRSFQALAALLRHPDAGALTDAGLEAVDLADGYFKYHLPLKVRGKIPRGQRRAALFPPLVRAIEQDWRARGFGGRKPLSQWMRVVMDVLLKVYEDFELERPSYRPLLDTLEQINSVATALANMPTPLDEECTGSQGIRALLLEVGENALPPEPDRDAVELLGWLDIALDDAPVVILTGFNESLLPQSVRGHAFLPDTLRTCLALPDNRRRMARDAYRLTTVLHSKKSVCLITGRHTTKDDPLLPSRLMFRIPEEQMPGRACQFWEEDRGAPDGFESPKESQFKLPPEPVITLEEDEVPVALRVTDFKPLIADPYRFVLERVYRLDSIDDCARELDPLAFGDLAHEILRQFGLLALTSPPKVDVCDELDIARVLKDLLIAEVSTRFGEGALPAVHIQAEQLQARMRAFATKQAEWAAEGWRIVAVECEADGEGVPFDVDDTPILLRGRIDRIDHNPKTGEWAVLDYKTSDSVDPPEKSHRKNKSKKELKELAEELGIRDFAALSKQDLIDRIQEAGGDDGHWIDLQLPLYRQLLSGIVDERGRRLVSDEADEILLGYVYLPKNLDDSEFIFADWSKEKLAFAEETARDAVRRLRERRFEFDRDVTKVSWFGRDALKPLLTKDWPDTREDEGAPSEDGSSEEESGQ